MLYLKVFENSFCESDLYILFGFEILGFDFQGVFFIHL